MCDFCRVMPMIGALSASMPSAGACSLLSQSMYSTVVSKTRGAIGCQIPWSGITSGSFTWKGARGAAGVSGRGGWPGVLVTAAVGHALGR